MKNVVAGTVLDSDTLYADEFQIEEDAPNACKDKGGKRIISYVVHTDGPGILAVSERKTRCKDDPAEDDFGGEDHNTDEFPNENEDPFQPPVLPIPDGRGDDPNKPTTPTPPLTEEPVPASRPANDCAVLCLAHGIFEIWWAAGVVAPATWFWDLVTSGDPHLTTVDGLHYDFQSVGEFDYAMSDEYGLHLQTRFVAGGADWSALDRAAMTVNGHVVQLGRDGTVLIDGAAVTIPAGYLADLGNNASVAHTAPGGTDRYVVVWPGGGDRPLVAFMPDSSAAAIAIHFPNDGPSDLRGLLGNADGNPANDLKLRDGTQLPATASAQTLYGAYADSWRITDETSLFTYAPGDGTATFTDTSFPTNVMTVHSLTPTEVSLGTEACIGQGVPPGPQLDDCIIDLAKTSNLHLAATAALRKNIAINPHACQWTAPAT
jgi:hypothetical protein